MFTIPLSACITVCSIYFGTVNWNEPWDAACFQLRGGLYVCLDDIEPGTPKAAAELQKIIGNRLVICNGKVYRARMAEAKINGDCYLDNKTNRGLNIAEEMQKRGY